MKTIFILTSLAAVLSSCSHMPPMEQMTESQRQAYVDHRRWDLEAEYRKEVDEQNRR